MIVDKARKPARRLIGFGRALVVTASVLALVGCTMPSAESPTATPGVAAVQSPLPTAVSAGESTDRPSQPISPPPTAQPSPSPTPDQLLAVIAHLPPSERPDDRTAASADWPIVAIDPEREQPTAEAKTVEETITHVVARGETLASIAKARGVEADAIGRANNLGDGNALSVGQRLAIPIGKQQTQVSTRRLAATLQPRFIWPARGFITTYFGERGAIWKGGWHTGLDIGANYGVPIVAAEAGVVLEAGWATTRGYGNYVKIDNGFGYQTLYGHMSVIRAKEGQWVNRGDRIGDVGSTGVSTGPHLHFELRIDGRELDPLQYLPKSPG